MDHTVASQHEDSEFEVSSHCPCGGWPYVGTQKLHLVDVSGHLQ